MGRDWDAEIDRWTERFRGEDRPPPEFVDALESGWEPAAKAAMASAAAAYESEQDAYVSQIRGAGVDLVRVDFKEGCCSVCALFAGKAFSLSGETAELPPPPPLPMCPACRPMLNLLTPYYMQSLGLDVDDLVAEARPYDEPR